MPKSQVAPLMSDDDKNCNSVLWHRHHRGYNKRLVVQITYIFNNKILRLVRVITRAASCPAHQQHDIAIVQSNLSHSSTTLLPI